VKSLHPKKLSIGFFENIDLDQLGSSETISATAFPSAKINADNIRRKVTISSEVCQMNIPILQLRLWLWKQLTKLAIVVLSKD
jgi:hypothetical protein